MHQAWSPLEGSAVQGAMARLGPPACHLVARNASEPGPRHLSFPGVYRGQQQGFLLRITLQEAQKAVGVDAVLSAEPHHPLSLSTGLGPHHPGPGDTPAGEMAQPQALSVGLRVRVP